MGINVLLVGNGGREHALAWRLSQSQKVNHIFVAPGNGGTANNQVSKTSNVDIGVGDFDKLVLFAKEKNVGLVIPGPEQPLVDGIETVFRKVGIPVFGPSELAARMEGSKTLSKDFMKKHSIPTAGYQNFSNFSEAEKHVRSVPYKVVIKASGLAAGKGVIIPQTVDEAVTALREIMEEKVFGDAGEEVVIEEYLEGDELSILTFSDGYTAISLPPAQDHKRIGEGDTGPNTGGMGTYAPAPIATETLQRQIHDTIIQPTIDGMRHDGFPFVGMLFTGIMLTSTGPKVLEYNVRFGDPETQSVLLLLTSDTDLLEVMLACVQGRLDAITLNVKDNAYAATVVMSAGGYPSSYKKGDEITIDDNLPPNTYVFHAGTKINSEGKLVTAGGRVIACSAVAPSLKEAVALAYQGVDKVHFRGKYCRRDIAHRAFSAAAKAEKSKTQGAITYASSGVSIENGNTLVNKIKAKVKSTARSGTESEIGGFGGLFDLKAAGYVDPLLIGATDGVGTKLLLANIAGKHDTVGIDLVAMNVNDLVVQGAEPLFFLDYFSCSKLDLQLASSFVSGVADGCIEAGCALIGGETAEMPGLYEDKDYDACGTAIGAVERGMVLPRKDLMCAGDIVLGIASDGVHSNGFSLIRKVVAHAKADYFAPAPWQPNKTLISELLQPTRVYVKSLLPIVKKRLILGMAHITGGGLVENIPRTLPNNLSAVIDAKSWPLPGVFKWLGQEGNIPKGDIAQTLNMGIGMACVVKPENVSAVVQELSKSGDQVYKIGYLTESYGDVSKCDVKNKDSWY